MSARHPTPGQTGNVCRLFPEVQRDQYGYLPGDYSVEMARAIAADIRRRALTEPGYLDHWKRPGAAPAQHASAHKTTPANPAPAAHAPQAGGEQADANATLEALRNHLQQVAAHQLNVAGFAEPELDFAP